MFCPDRRGAGDQFCVEKSIPESKYAFGDTFHIVRFAGLLKLTLELTDLVRQFFDQRIHPIGHFIDRFA